MTYLVERLAELRRHLDHLRTLRPRVHGPGDLERDLSLHNDVLFSLLTVAQLVIDIAGDLSARRGDRFEDYREAIRNLARDGRFPATLVERLEPVSGTSSCTSTCRWTCSESLRRWTISTRSISFSRSCATSSTPTPDRAADSWLTSARSDAILCDLRALPR